MKTKFSFVITMAVLIASAAMAADSPLGSPANTARQYSKDYNVAVRSALPKADAAYLDKLLAGVREAAAAEKPLAIMNPRSLERSLGLRERGDADASGFIDAGDAVYRIDPERQRMYLVHRYGEVQRVSRQAFAAELPAIRAAHQEAADRLGIPRNEVMFVDFREILSETDGHPEFQKGVIGEIQAEGAITTILRSVGGILVEGSYFNVSSLDAKRLDLVDLSWPMLRLSEEALKQGLRSPQESLQGIVERVSSISMGQAVNVRMAIVLRPLLPDRVRRVIEFVPSLKVGVEPQSVKTESGYRTDAGEVFFVDLIRGAPPYVGTQATDSPESKAIAPAAKR